MKINTHRYNFLNGLADQKNYHSYICPIHNILIREGEKCCECEHSKRIEKCSQEIMDKKLFGSTRKDKDEQIKNADTIKLSLKRKYKKENKIRANRIKEKMKNNDYRERKNKTERESVRRKKMRRLGHSL